MRTFSASAMIAAALWAVPAAAQDKIPVNDKFDVASKPVKIHSSMPISCDDNIRNAAAKFNQAGANFQFTGATNHYGTNRVNNDNTEEAYVNIQPATMSPYTDSTTLMKTYKYYAWFDGFVWENYYELIDANIYVNDTYIMYAGETAREKDLWCETATTGIGNRSDFESVMIHEFGHAAGMEHRTDGTTGPCVMTASYSPGKIRRTFCTDEIAKLKIVYGTR